MDDLYTSIQQTKSALEARLEGRKPTVAIVLGSGLSGLADQLENAVVIPYSEIPGFPLSTVHGHRGELAIGELGGKTVAVQRGRFHYYEGYSMQQVTFPIRVFKALGCETLLLTNAAGGLRAEWSVGDLMCLTDQIFMPGMAGNHPLRGPNDDRLGPRFPPMLHPFDDELSASAHRHAERLGITLHDGVYMMLSGPAFETAAEIRLARAVGADAVGMSTAPEVIVARHMDMRVMAISLVTNLALPDGEAANHAEVLEAGEAAKDGFGALIQGVVADI